MHILPLRRRGFFSTRTHHTPQCFSQLGRKMRQHQEFRANGTRLRGRTVGCVNFHVIRRAGRQHSRAPRGREATHPRQQSIGLRGLHLIAFTSAYGIAYHIAFRKSHRRNPTNQTPQIVPPTRSQSFQQPSLIGRVQRGQRGSSFPQAKCAHGTCSDCLIHFTNCSSVASRSEWVSRRGDRARMREPTNIPSSSMPIPIAA